MVFVSNHSSARLSRDPITVGWREGERGREREREGGREGEREAYNLLIMRHAAITTV